MDYEEIEELMTLEEGHVYNHPNQDGILAASGSDFELGDVGIFEEDDDQKEYFGEVIKTGIEGKTMDGEWNYIDILEEIKTEFDRDVCNRIIDKANGNISNRDIEEVAKEAEDEIKLEADHDEEDYRPIARPEEEFSWLWFLINMYIKLIKFIFRLFK